MQGFCASPLTDSNRRPPPYHGGALPTELRGRSLDCSQVSVARWPQLGRIWAKALYDERKAVARDNGHGLPCVGAFSAARLPDLSIETDLAIGATGGCDGRGPPDQGLDARLGAAVPNCAVPEGQFAEEERNAHGETMRFHGDGSSSRQTNPAMRNTRRAYVASIGAP